MNRGNDVLGQIFGSRDVSRTGALLDLNNDGNPLDDILRMGGQLMR